MSRRGDLIRLGMDSNGNDFTILDGYLLIRDGHAIRFGTDSDALMEWAATEGIVTGPGPSTGLYADAPFIQQDPALSYRYFEDFLTLPIDDATANPVGWTVATDADGDCILKTGELGGVLSVQTDATDNDETVMQLGTGATGTMFEFTASSAKKLWASFRVKAVQTTEGAIFVGLAEEGLGADFLADNTGVPDDKDFIGFRLKTDANDEWDIAWRLDGQAEQEVADVATNAGGWHTFGIYFDGATTVYFYVDGTVNATTATVGAATFPSGEELAPIIAIKTGEAVLKEVDVDWIDVIVLR